MGKELDDEGGENTIRIHYTMFPSVAPPVFKSGVYISQSPFSQWFPMLGVKQILEDLFSEALVNIRGKYPFVKTQIMIANIIDGT